MNLFVAVILENFEVDDDYKMQKQARLLRNRRRLWTSQQAWRRGHLIPTNAHKRVPCKPQ